MKWQKFSADALFDGKNLSAGQQVVITDAHGTVSDIVSPEDAGDDVQTFSGVLSPAFVNCHCHLELSHMKGLIPEKTGLVDFVIDIVTKRHFAVEEIVAAAQAADQTMYQNGIVAVGDICNNVITLPVKQAGRLHYYSFVETSGWNPAIAEDRFSRSKEAFDAYAGTMPASIVPHAPYSVSPALWQMIAPYFRGKVVSIHNQETNFEDEFFIQNSGDFVRMYDAMRIDSSFFAPSGKSSLQTYFEKLCQAGSILLVHNTFTQQADISFAHAAAGAVPVYFCLCINANLYIENAVPPIDLLRKNNCRITLGTDSLASNHSLSVLDEMRSVQQHFPHVGLTEMLIWATRNGAQALQMDDQLGAIKKGKRPGLIVLENVGEKDTLQHAAVRRVI